MSGSRKNSTRSSNTSSAISSRRTSVTNDPGLNLAQVDLNNTVIGPTSSVDNNINHNITPLISNGSNLSPIPDNSSGDGSVFGNINIPAVIDSGNVGRVSSNSPAQTMNNHIQSGQQSLGITNSNPNSNSFNNPNVAARMTALENKIDSTGESNTMDNGVNTVGSSPLIPINSNINHLNNYQPNFTGYNPINSQDQMIAMMARQIQLLELQLKEVISGKSTNQFNSSQDNASKEQILTRSLTNKVKQLGSSISTKKTITKTEDINNKYISISPYNKQRKVKQDSKAEDEESHEEEINENIPDLEDEIHSDDSTEEMEDEYTNNNHVKPSIKALTRSNKGKTVYNQPSIIDQNIGHNINGKAVNSNSFSGKAQYNNYSPDNGRTMQNNIGTNQTNPTNNPEQVDKQAVKAQTTLLTNYKNEFPQVRREQKLCLEGHPTFEQAQNWDFNWKQVMNATVLGKYLINEPEISWKEFKEQFNLITSAKMVEQAYLLANTAAYAYTLSTLPPSIAPLMDNEIRRSDSVYHLPTVLEFSYNDKNFYQNVHELHQMILKTYGQATIGYTTSLNMSLSKLQYNDDTGISGLLDEYRAIRSNLHQYGEGHQPPPVEQQVLELLTKLPPVLVNKLGIHIKEKVEKKEFKNLNDLEMFIRNNWEERPKSDKPHIYRNRFDKKFEPAIAAAAYDNRNNNRNQTNNGYQRNNNNNYRNDKDGNNSKFNKGNNNNYNNNQNNYRRENNRFNNQEHSRSPKPPNQSSFSGNQNRNGEGEVINTSSNQQEDQITLMLYEASANEEEKLTPANMDKMTQEMIDELQKANNEVASYKNKILKLTREVPELLKKNAEYTRELNDLKNQISNMEAFPPIETIAQTAPAPIHITGSQFHGRGDIYQSENALLRKKNKVLREEVDFLYEEIEMMSNDSRYYLKENEQLKQEVNKLIKNNNIEPPIKLKRILESSKSNPNLEGQEVSMADEDHNNPTLITQTVEEQIEQEHTYATYEKENPFSDGVVLDTGSTVNIAKDVRLLDEVKDANSISIATIHGENRDIKSHKVGYLQLNKRYRLGNVRYVPKSLFNIASAGSICDTGRVIVFDKYGAYILPIGKIKFQKSDVELSATRVNKLWLFDANLFNPDNEEQAKQRIMKNFEKHEILRKSKPGKPKDPDNKSNVKPQADPNSGYSKSAREALMEARKQSQIESTGDNDSVATESDNESVTSNTSTSTTTSKISTRSTGSIPKTNSPKQQLIEKVKPQVKSPVSQSPINNNNAKRPVPSQSISEPANTITDQEEFSDFGINLMITEVESSNSNIPESTEVIETNNTEIELKQSNQMESDSESKEVIPDNSKALAELKLIHNRFGHIGYDAMKLINKLYELKLSKSQLKLLKELKCTICDETKMKRANINHAHPNRNPIAIEVNDCWHADLMGPFSAVEDTRKVAIKTLEHHTYLLVVVDEYSRYTMVVPLQKKSDAAEELINLIKKGQNLSHKRLVTLHTDGGTEFLNKQLKSFLLESGIELTTTVPHTPQLNGIVERKNQTLTIIARSLLHQCNAPLELWNHAYKYAAYITNIIPNTHLSIEKIPLETFLGGRYSPTTKHIKVFGCDAYVLIEEGNRGKLQPTSKPHIFIGVNQQYGAYQFINPETMKIVISRDAKFVEDKFTCLRSIVEKIKSIAEERIDQEEEYEVERIIASKVIRKKNYYCVLWKGYRKPTWEPESNLTNCRTLLDQHNKLVASAVEATNVVFETPPDDDTITEITLAAAGKKIYDRGYVIPQTFLQAMRHVDKIKWTEAIKAELIAMREQQVFIPATPESDRKIIGNRWVFDVKRNEKGVIIKHKARLVVQGFSQVEGIDFYETFSPTVRIKSIKILLAIATQDDLEIKQLDFKTAFLNAELKEDIYMKIPDGYEDAIGNHTTVKLNKALYGLKQAPREWWQQLNQFLESLGYKSSPLDECLYFKKIENQFMYLTIYVDDTLIFYDKSLEHIWLEDKAQILNRYKIDDLDDAKWILKMEIIRDRPNKILKLSQSSYMESILTNSTADGIEFPAPHPFAYDDLTTTPKPTFIPEPLTTQEHTLYRSIIGSLLYSANITRIDLSYIIGILARFCTQPMNYHLHAAKRVLRYVRATSGLQLQFNASENDNNPYKIIIYTDSSWGDNKDDRKGTGGHITMINNRPVSWQSKKHSTTPLSSTEAEFYALTNAVTEALFIRQWFEVYKEIDIPIKILCDNEGAIHMSDHTTNHNRTKHIDIKHFFIREHVKTGNKISVDYINTTDQLADILTKSFRSHPNVYNGLTQRLLSQ